MHDIYLFYAQTLGLLGPLTTMLIVHFLVEEGAIGDFIKVQVADAYEAATGVKPQIYVCEVGDRVKELKGVES